MTALDLAYRLIEAGIPVLRVKGGKAFPSDWENAQPNPTALTGFREGVDALVMVSGHGIDVVDEDSKVGGTVDALPPFKNFGVVRTPSGGRHFYVPGANIGTRRLPEVGDYQGGRNDGSSRGLVFLPGSVRPKYPDGGYVIEHEIQIGECITGTPNPDLVRALGTDSGSLPTYIDDSPERTEPGLHPYAEAVISRELGRLRALQEDGWAGEPWDSTTYAVACNLIEMANSHWTGYTLEQAEEDLLEAAPQDEGFGERNHREKWDSAVAKVGNGGRRNPDASHDIWDASPTLKTIQQAAHARMVGSGALLCYVLGRVLAEAPPHVVLPPVVGAAAPLNVAFAFVGKSGTGKSGASRVSAELLDLSQDPIETGVGSGEGLIESFLEPDPQSTRGGKRLVSPASRILEIDEIGRLGSVARREGSSMMHVLRSGLTGGALKTSNAATERVRNVPAGAYRLVVFAGVQPELSDVLLGEVNAGTPQRFCWVASTDATVPEHPPAWPGVLDWTPVVLEMMPPTELDYPEHIKAEIKRERWRAVTGKDVDPRHGHRMLTQLKVAAALALLHNETRISDQWWDIAAHIMRWSEKEQQRCLAALREAAERKAESRAKSAVIERRVLENDMVQRTQDRLMSVLTKEPARWNKVRERMSSPQREVFDDAVDRLVRDGKIVVEVGEYQGQPLRNIRLQAGRT